MLKKIINLIFYNLKSLQYSVKERIEKNGGKVGRGVFLGQDVLIDYDYAFLLEIEDGAVISARTIIELHDSSLPNTLGRGKLKVGKVRIGRRAYVGVNSVILPGVEIGDGSILGACSMLNKDIPPGEVWVGIPAGFLCTVSDLASKRQEDSNPKTAFIEWIGELEKKPNYGLLKANFLHEVRRHFGIDQ